MIFPFVPTAVVLSMISLAILPGCEKQGQAQQEELRVQLQAKNKEIETLNRQIEDLKADRSKAVQPSAVDSDKLTASVVDAVAKHQSEMNAELAGKIDQILQAVKGGGTPAAAEIPHPAASRKVELSWPQTPAIKNTGTVASKEPGAPVAAPKDAHAKQAPPTASETSGKQTLDYAKSL
jgi:hypothetical protein